MALRKIYVFISIIALFSLCSSVMAGVPGGRPKPDYANVKYGSYERNVLDIWLADADVAAPLVIFFHGGGFSSGDKSSISPLLLKKCLDAGISVAAVNYRLSGQAPFPAQMLDSARAVQFLRSKAKEWNLDPKRFGATGGSAGAGISLWIGFHDDMANPKSDDPIERESTRLSCMATSNGQCSYDPRFFKELFKDIPLNDPNIYKLYGITPSEIDTPKAQKLFEEASPINCLTRDDPPVLMCYTMPNDPPRKGDPTGKLIHHPLFGIKLKEKMDMLGIECLVSYPWMQIPPNVVRNQVDDKIYKFFAKHFFGSSEKKEPQA